MQFVYPRSTKEFQELVTKVIVRCWLLRREENRRNSEKNSQNRDENQQQTQPTRLAYKSSSKSSSERELQVHSTRSERATLRKSINPHMTSSPGIEPAPHCIWLEVSALNHFAIPAQTRKPRDADIAKRTT